VPLLEKGHGPAERPFRKLCGTGGTSRKGFLHNPEKTLPPRPAGFARRPRGKSFFGEVQLIGNFYHSQNSENQGFFIPDFAGLRGGR
jgi:hypothetical protein